MSAADVPDVAGGDITPGGACRSVHSRTRASRDQLADVPGDFHRMVRIACAHLERAMGSAPDDWSGRMVEAAHFNARRVLPEHVSAYEQELRRRKEVNA